MTWKTFKVNISGYWRDKDKITIPKHSGIYFVYEAAYISNNNTLSIKRLIYIGESRNVNKMVLKHRKISKWLKFVNSGNELCYSVVHVESAYRTRIEAAYIYEHKPPANEEYKNNFPFNKTRIKSTGETELLNTDFTVDKTI